MTFVEAAEAVRPFITAKNAARYNCQIDKMLWIEEFIMVPAGVESSIATDFGWALALWIEDHFDKDAF